MTTLSVQNQHSLGFAEHATAGSIKQLKNVKNVQLISGGILIVGAAVAAVMLALTGVGLIPVAIAATVAACAIIFPACGFIASCIAHAKVKNATVGILNHADAKIELRTKDYQTSCQSMPCLDTKDSFEWRKRLIRNAEHNILLSGNYCGGTSFIEILNLIDAQMALKPNLKVIILSSDHFLKANHYEKANELAKKYEGRFSLVQTPDDWRICPGGLKKATNHTKALIVDYGKYFMLGGSGIEDKYAYKTGTEPPKIKIKDENSPKKIKKKKKTFIENLMPRGFRDLDFVFKSESKHEAGLPEQTVGHRLFDEFLKLSYHWESLHPKSVIQGDSSFLALDLLKAPVLKLENIATEVPEFTANETKALEDQIEIFCTGSEHRESPFLKKIIEQLSKVGVDDEIIIDHMYFHPPKILKQALIQAIERGAKFTLITNGHGKANTDSNNLVSPKGHAIFGARNRYEYSSLFCALSSKAKERVSIYEYAVPKTTLHRKAMVISSEKENVACVIAGSSNFGYKSLVTTSDHEINFICHSKKFVEQTKFKLEEDIEHSEKIKSVESYSRKEWFKALRHRLLAPIIG